MFRRSAIDWLNTWKTKENRKPLVIRGARQVGKTSLVEEFGKQFDLFLSFNLEKSEDLALFQRELPVKELFELLLAMKNRTKSKGATLLFIDEIQNSPYAIKLLRYFYEEMPEIHVIAAGSLLETMLNRQLSFPVGRVEYIALRPCTFVEFLGALGETALEEMDFLMEARHMKEFANNQKEVRYIKPIRVYDEYCTRNALVMEYIGGYNINQLDSLKKDGYDIKEISEKLAYNYIKQALDDGFFHADPHSDNIKIDDGKIVFLDFGMMGRLTHHNRKLLDACIRAIVSNEYSEVGHILTVMNTNNYPIDHMRLNNDIKRVLDKNKTAEIANIDIKGFALDMFSMLNDNKIILPRDITMLLRGIIVIAGLLEEIDPTVSLMQVLQTYFDPKDMFTKDKLKDYASTVVRSGADLMVIPKEALTLLKGINSVC